MLGSIFNFARNLQTFLLSKHPFINKQIFFSITIISMYTGLGRIGYN